MLRGLVMKQSQVLLAAQNTLARAGLKHMLSPEAFSISDEEPTLQDALSFLRSTTDPIDLIVYDRSEHRDEDVACLAAISEEFPHVAVAVLISGEGAQGLDAAIKGSARAFLPNTISPKALNLVLQLLRVGENLITTPSIITDVLGSAASPAQQHVSHEPRVPLSPRETAILQFLKEGAPNKLIARELDLAEVTVK